MKLLLSTDFITQSFNLKKMPISNKIESSEAKTSRQNQAQDKTALISRKWLSYITIEGSLATVFIILTGGVFLTGLALMLGANDFEIGLLAAIPFLSQVAQLLSAFMVDATGKRKSIAVWFSVLGRQVWWILIPVLFLSGDWRLEALIVVVIISNVAIMISSAGWLPWIADLVPGRIRGRYFGNRNAAIAIATISATLVGGAVLDIFRGVHQESVGFAIIIGLGCSFALAAAILLNRLPDKPAELIRSNINWSHLMEPLQDRKFRRLLKIFVAWNIAIGTSAAFFAPHMLNNLKMSFTLISVYSAVAALVAVLLNKPWGKIIDRFGSKPVLAFCAFGIALVPLIWWIPRPGYIWILAPESIWTGILWTGFTLAAFNIPIACSPKERRTIYLAMFSVVTGLAFFAASVVGGILAQSWSHMHFQLGKQTVVNYHILFAISGALRLLAAFMILTFHEPREKGVPDMIQFMKYSILRCASIGRLASPWATKIERVFQIR